MCIDVLAVYSICEMKGWLHELGVKLYSIRLLHSMRCTWMKGCVSRDAYIKLFVSANQIVFVLA